jgi:hypothetical protein
MTGVGARSVTAVALLAGTAALLWSAGILRGDYWAQLDPVVCFLAAGFAVLCGTLVFEVWRLVDRSEYYFRIGERLPWAAEVALGGPRYRTLIVGHAPHTDVIDFPPLVQRALYVAVFLGIAIVAVTNRAVALLREQPRAAAADREYCAEPKPPEPETRTPAGCKLVIRAYQLGYAKTLGSCAPRAAEQKIEDVCRKRQRDEPYLHYAWRLLEDRMTALGDGVPGSRGSTGSRAPQPGLLDRLGPQLDHLGVLAASTVDAVAMRSRSSHHLFTNLPDPRPALAEQIATALERGCGARLAQLTHFPRIEDTPLGRSKLFEHVIDQLLFNPAYKPVVAQCGELVIHWGAPADTCAALVARPRELLGAHGALQPVVELTAWRQRRVELSRLHMAETDVAAADRIVSFQCLMFGDTDEPVTERAATVAGETLHVRDTRMRPLGADGASQIRLYKRLASLFAEGFSYGHLTSNESITTRPDDTAMIAAFRDPGFLLTKLDLLRDADLFVGNAWLAERGELLEVYPYHLHLQNFIEIFRRQYRLHRGRL